jgi:hypothetical protein
MGERLRPNAVDVWIGGGTLVGVGILADFLIKHTVYPEETAAHGDRMTQLHTLEDTVAEKNSAIDALEDAHEQAQDAGLPVTLSLDALRDNVKQDKTAMETLKVQDEPYDHVILVSGLESVGIGFAAGVAAIVWRARERRRRAKTLANDEA